MKRTNLVVAIWIAVFLCGTVALAQTMAPPSNSNSSPLNTQIASVDDKSALIVKLEDFGSGYRVAQWRYSWAYHFCIYLAAVLSALAAWLSKVHVKSLGMDDPTKRDT